ncbi:hypothetical protein ACFPVT_03435 [Corynebacterium choanae]|uniref:DprA winged helix domain-containing protein n=1 Tax=Corynebacterium choanae TaxID=1862358 RepID=A0A3G6J9C7_9CORY|nr:hypothetical protein [Corynebacterium choanae]AZA14667.1 hypothetical protein CCHOA_11480 [Corynebacterium choanae]
MTAQTPDSGTPAKVDPLPWVEAQIANNAVLTEPEIVEATGADPGDVDSLMRFLNLLGHIVKDPEGPVRGPGVRWIRKPGT